MKWCLIGILITLIMIIAKAVSDQYKDKYNFYFNLKNLLVQFQINLSFKKDKVIDFLNKSSGKKQFKTFIDEYKNYLEGGEICLDKITLLDDYEKEDLIEIITNLGSSNSENEIKKLASFIEIINLKLEKAQQDKNKLCPLIIKLSLLFSLALSILLI